MLWTGQEMQRPGGNAEGRQPGKRKKFKFEIWEKKQIKIFDKTSKEGHKKALFYSQASSSADSSVRVSLFVLGYTFYRTQVYMGSDLWVRVSVCPSLTKRGFADLTDVALADDQLNTDW